MPNTPELPSKQPLRVVLVPRTLAAGPPASTPADSGISAAVPNIYATHPRWLLLRIPASGEPAALDILDHMLGVFAKANEQFANPDPEQRRDAVVSNLHAVCEFVDVLSGFQNNADRVERRAYPLAMLAMMLQSLPKNDVHRLFKFRSIDQYARAIAAACVDLLVKHAGWTLHRAAEFVGNQAGMLAPSVVAVRDNVRFERASAPSVALYRAILRQWSGARADAAVQHVKRLLGGLRIGAARRTNSADPRDNKTITL